MGVRTRLLFAAVGAVALALVIGVAAFNMVLTQRLTDNAVSLAHAQAEEELASLEVLGGKLVVREGLEPADEALLDTAGQRHPHGQPESARDHELPLLAGQFEQGERVAVGLAEDPVTYPWVEQPGNRRVE